MTRDEILAMKPGRDLNLLVADHVMWWQYGEDYFESGGHLVTGKGHTSDFSESISAAWEVVEKMRTTGFAFGYYADANDDGSPFPIEASFWKPVVYPMTANVFEGSGETAPEAICKSALLAVMDL